jgi:hypothetical protein
MPLFTDVPSDSSLESLEEDNQQEEYPDMEFDYMLPS